MNDIKALYVIVNSGFSSEIVDIARECGAKGATIMNARGSVANPKTILGITIDTEKEIVLCITDGETAKKIVEAVKERSGSGTAAHGLSFCLPVDMSTLNAENSAE